MLSLATRALCMLLARPSQAGRNLQVGPTVLSAMSSGLDISGDSMRLGVQVKGQIAPMSDMADHAFTAYLGALHATCKAQSSREKASGRAGIASAHTTCNLLVIVGILEIYAHWKGAT